MTLMRHWSTTWTPAEWDEAIAAAQTQAADAGREVDRCFRAAKEAATAFIDAEEWIATVTAAKARLCALPAKSKEME